MLGNACVAGVDTAGVVALLEAWHKPSPDEEARHSPDHDAPRLIAHSVPRTTLPKPRLSSGAAASTGMDAEVDAEAPRAAEGRGGGRRRRYPVMREGFHPPSHGVTITPPQNISQMHS